jgi:hypothetical protein
MHHLLCILLHFVAFLCIFRTNLLTRYHGPSSLFSAVFLCFRKATQEILSELDETKPEPPIFLGHKTKTEGELEGGGGQGAAPIRGWRAPS